VAIDRVENILKSGLEGYLVHLQLSEADAGSFSGFEAVRRTGTISEFYVPCSAFNAFMGAVNSSGREVVLVETKRRDLEDFFLSLVTSSQSSR
jgi:ABC-2 type transport system ATP-binding protein